MLKTMRLALCVLLFQGLAALPVIASEVEYSKSWILEIHL